jgi:HEAT repeats
MYNPLVGKFVAYIFLLAALAGAAAWYAQQGTLGPWQATETSRPPGNDDWLEHLYSRNPRDADAATDEVKALGEKAIPVLRAVLRDPGTDRDRRKAALKACGLLEHTAAPVIPEVAAQMTNPDLTEEAAMALSFMGTAAFAPLLEGFSSGDPALRRESLRSIGKLKSRAPIDGRAVIPLLISGLMDDVPSVRVVAATYLGIIHEQPDDSVPALMVALEDPDIEVRRAAATALGSFGEAAEPAAAALRKAAGDRDPDLAREAGRALISVRPSGR